MKRLLLIVAGAISGIFALLIFLSWPKPERLPTPAPPAVTAAAPVALPRSGSAAVQTSGKSIAAAPVVDDKRHAASTPPPALPSALLIPVDGIRPSQLTDTYDQARGSERRHQALDILAPKGTKVFAMADGRLVKLFNSKPGGLTVYQFDTTEQFAYYYAHLDRYADGLTEGMLLKRGDLIGFVGSTGNADPSAPHLHLAIFVLTPEKQWWKGEPINPYPLLQNVFPALPVPGI